MNQRSLYLFRKMEERLEGVVRPLARFEAASLQSLRRADSLKAIRNTAHAACILFKGSRLGLTSLPGLLLLLHPARSKMELKRNMKEDKVDLWKWKEMHSHCVRKKAEESGIVLTSST